MPRPKVIDDAKLTELFKQGKSLTEIGKALSVTHVAVHKRIKRLGLSRLPKSLENLTDREKGFVMAVASGQSRISAAMQSYDVTTRESAKALQKTLMKNPEIRTAIDDLMEQKGIGRDFRIQKLGEHMKHPDPVVSLKALDMGFKLADDAGESKKHISDKSDITVFDLTPYRNVTFFSKIEGKCSICQQSAADYFCDRCLEKYPVLIDRIKRHWNGDKCATCRDDRRSYAFCTACNFKQKIMPESEGGIV